MNRLDFIMDGTHAKECGDINLTASDFSELTPQQRRQLSRKLFQLSLALMVDDYLGGHRSEMGEN